MKTRSRTQVRQRYGFIQHMMKTKPGWTVARVKRRQLSGVSKALEITQKNVEKVKEEIIKVESVFKLSKVESDTFRIEKLKELRDKIMFKKFDLKRKKRVFSDSSEVNNLLMEYFKCTPHKPPVTPATFRNNCDSNCYLNEVLIMAKYFGHELELPQFEDEIWANPRLSHNLKSVLKETISVRTGLPTNHIPTSDTSCSSTSVSGENNIDYIVPSTDDSLLMNDWWHTPPVDVTRLNFSEFFKRTVFDYSYGMHRDIWSSKINRSPVVNLSCLSETPEPSPARQQPYYMPPNHLTTLGLRSLLLSRARLRRDSTEKGFSGKLFPKLEKGEESEVSVKVDCELTNRLFDQFQETMITLFTWPKVLSLTNIDSTQLTQTNGNRVIPIQPTHSSKIATLLSNLSEQVQYDGPEVERKNASIKKERVRQSILERNQDRRRELLAYKRGISYGRKMKIEHLVKDVKLKPDKMLPNLFIPQVRKRGRPPSNTSIPESCKIDQFPCNTTDVEPRKRGRPPSNAFTAGTCKRGRGRPPSNASTSRTLEKDDLPSNNSTPVALRRGRPKKSSDISSSSYVDQSTTTRVRSNSDPEQLTNNNSVDSLSTDKALAAQTTDTGDCSYTDVNSLSTPESDGVKVPGAGHSLILQPTKVTYRRSARNMKKGSSPQETYRPVQKKAKHGRHNENITINSSKSCQNSFLEDHPDTSECNKPNLQ